MKKISVFLLVAFVSLSSLAQKGRNFIYIFDCTYSMKTNGIWESSLEYLLKGIDCKKEGDKITIQPFKDKIKEYDPITFDKTDCNWNDLKNTLEEILHDKAPHTDICKAWEKGLQYIDKNRYNYVYLLTDGQHNYGKGEDDVCAFIQQWCENHKDTRAFYVMLHKTAQNVKILEAIKNCPDFDVLLPGEHRIPFVFDKNEIRINARDKDAIAKMHTDCGDEVALSINQNDPYFTLSLRDGCIRDGYGYFTIKPKKNLDEINKEVGDEYIFDISLSCSSADYVIAHPNLRVVVSNKTEKTLDIIDGAEETVCHHDWFLFCPSSGIDTAKIDLKAKYNQYAIDAESSVTFKVSCDEGLDGLTLYYNDKPVSGNIFKVNASDKESILKISFDVDAKDGVRHLRLTPLEVNNVDRINQEEAKAFEMNVEAEYNEDWNPLKTILFWLLIILGAVLLIWFCVIKWWYYPIFKGIDTMTIMDGGDGNYYKVLDVKKKRKIVLTAQAKKQGWFSKFFTGEILYEVHSRYSSPIEFTPDGSQKMRAHCGANYMMTPSTSMEVANEYELTHLADNKVSKIIII